MADWLVLRLARAAEEPVSWLLADGDGRAQSTAQSGTLTAAAAAAATGNRRIAVLVPTTEALLADVDLPHNSGGRAAQLVPYALEEQLVAEVDSQHFAVEPSRSGARTAVAVVARANMEHWLEQLHAAGMQPDLLCVDAALLPRLTGYSVALLEGDLLTVQSETGSAISVSAPSGGFASALEVALGGHAAGVTLLFHCTPMDWQRRSAEVEAVRPQVASLKVQLLSSGVLPWLAAQLHSAAPINLLQGAYAQRGAPGAQWRRWRLAAALAGALLVAHVGNQTYRLWSLQHNEKDLDAATVELAGPALNAAAGGGSLRSRLERALLGAQSSADRAGLMPALQVLAQALGAAPGARVEALSFRDGAVQLKVRARDSQSLERVNQALRSSGWQAEVVSGAPAGDAYEGNIQLHGGNS